MPNATLLNYVPGFIDLNMVPYNVTEPVVCIFSLDQVPQSLHRLPVQCCKAPCVPNRVRALICGNIFHPLLRAQEGLGFR